MYHKILFYKIARKFRGPIKNTYCNRYGLSGVNWKQSDISKDRAPSVKNTIVAHNRRLQIIKCVINPVYIGDKRDCKFRATL